VAYSKRATATKASIPLVVIALVEASAAALPQMGVTIDKGTLYQLGIAGYSAVIAAVNFFKNRKK
jgi:hypothetical protein